MRIALVDFSRGWGGAEELLLSLARGLRDRGHHVGMLLRGGSETVEKFESNGFDVWTSTPGMLGLPSMASMAAAVRRNKYDIIHVHRNHDLIRGKIAGCFSRDIPLVLTQHCQLGSTSYLIMNLADKVAAVSWFIANGISQRYPRLQDRLRVLHNGIDVESFANARRDYWSARPELAAKGPFLGVVGYFYKKQEELVALLPRIKAVFPGVMLIIIGHDVSKIEMLKSKVSEAGVQDSVYFAGNIPHEEMKHALASLDLNVSAFKKEGFGLSVIEGMAVGTPFIGYCAGGYKEIVAQGKTGYLVENQDEFADVLIRVLGDRTLMDLLAQNAIAEVKKRFSIDAMLLHYELMYAELLDIASH